MNSKMFCSEVELGSFLGSIDVIPYAYDAILKTASSYELHSNHLGFDVLAFNFLAFDCSPDYTTRFLRGDFNLVSSENLKVVDFIPTKINPSFSINEAAVSLFDHLFVELSSLKDKLICKSLIVTGRSLGGYIAILFTLWLQHVVDVEESNGSKNTKRPICITFGSPLVGDEALQRATFERPQWKSSFLNVVAKTDPVPSLFPSNGAYKPFGTYLFCTESGGCTSFEDHDSILAVLDTMAASSSAGNSLMHDYGIELSSIKRKALYRGVSELGEFNFSSLGAGIALQLMEIGVVDTQENNSSNLLIEKMEVKQAKTIRSKRNVYEPTKKLNVMKISLTYMEWYMKATRSKGGYYDSYKNAKSREEKERRNIIVFNQRRLNQYWKMFVEEKDRMPQKEGAKLRKRWLYGGTNFRRIVEPLDIAEYYEKGKKNYVATRPNYYKLLEKMLIEDNNNLTPRNKAASLTEDSCFWAYVEEALISLRDLQYGGSSRNAADIERELVQFEADVMRSINEYSVSPDIFLEGSSFMKWWSEYKVYRGSLCTSLLAQYMNNRSYKSYH